MYVGRMGAATTAGGSETARCPGDQWGTIGDNQHQAGGGALGHAAHRYQGGPRREHPRAGVPGSMGCTTGRGQEPNTATAGLAGGPIPGPPAFRTSRDDCGQDKQTKIKTAENHPVGKGGMTPG